MLKLGQLLHKECTRQDKHPIRAQNQTNSLLRIWLPGNIIIIIKLFKIMDHKKVLPFLVKIYRA